MFCVSADYIPVVLIMNFGFTICCNCLEHCNMYGKRSKICITYRFLMAGECWFVCSGGRSSVSVQLSFLAGGECFRKTELCCKSI
jgi:hypothetical protein